jgi:hypothetical protein
MRDRRRRKSERMEEEDIEQEMEIDRSMAKARGVIKAGRRVGAIHARRLTGD